MAVSYGSTIKRDGLLFHLDAANPKSYPGSGNTWYDLSGNGNHFTLYNAPAWNSGGWFDFNGIDEYARSNNIVDASGGNYAIIEATFYNDPTKIMFVWELSSDWNTNVGGCGLVVNSNGTGYASGLHHQNHKGGAEGRNFEAPTTEGWFVSHQMFAGVADSTGTVSYLQGEQKNFPSTTYSGGTTSIDKQPVIRDDYWFIASRNGTSTFFDGPIAGIKCYVGNKFTADDIKTNFIAVRSRYGI